MKPKPQLKLIALLLAMAPLGALAQTTFFTDTFANGSTTNGPSVPGGTPTASFTSYDIASTKSATASTIAPGDFTLRLNTSTTAGWVESQALFTTNPVALSTVGDYIDISVVFTNTPQTNASSANLPVSSLMVGTTSPIYVGLYDSGGGNLPVAGGLVNSGLGGTATFLTGNCANWKGYVSQITSNGTSRISTRPLQVSATTSAAQDLIAGSGNTGGYSGPAGTVIATTPVAPVPLVSGGQYTLYLRITLIAGNTLGFSNSIYSGSGLSGPIIYYQTNAIATNATFLTANFDGFSIGAFNKSPSGGPAINPTMDITSIKITGQTTVITNPPTITSQPVSATVASNGSCIFSVSATGFGMQYQWHRNGANLNAGGNISVSASPDAATSTLVISSAGPADVASGVNGYYVTVTGTGGYFTNSVTNSLVVVPATNLVWTAAGGSVWDLNNTVSWQDTDSNPQTFNYGDSVRFDDTAPSKYITLTGSYLGASSVTVDSESGATYTFTGSGIIAGPGKLIYTGLGQLTLNTANTYSGGTLVSNTTGGTLYVYLQNYNGLGTGPVILDNAAGTMEIAISGSATVGINGPINVLDDFKIQTDGVGTFATVFLGDLSGTSGKTLTINPAAGGTTNRFRAYGTNTVFNANLVLNNVDSPTSEALYNGTVLAPYQPLGSQTYNGVISGVGGIVQRGNGTTFLNGLNTYSGGTFITAGAVAFGINTVGTVASGPICTGPLYVSTESGAAAGGGGTGQVLASGGARTIANPIQYPNNTNNQTILIGGTNNLTFTGPLTLNGNDGLGSPTNRTIQVTNTGLTTLSGVISDGGLGFGLIKTGVGVLALDNAETYTGPTTNSAGILQIDGSLAAASAVTVSSNATLSGTGTINGTVTVNAGGTLAPGTTSLGTLTINNVLTLAGNVKVRVNRSGFVSDQANVTNTLSNTGTGSVMVTNLGTALHVGDTFAVFNKAVTGGGTLKVIGAGVGWNNQLAVNGTIIVSSTNLPAITAAVTGGSTLNLTWPKDYLGWQVQSNSVGLTASTNWFVVPNSGNATNLVITPSLTRTNVFYRLIQQ